MRDTINGTGYSLSRDDVKTMMMTVLFSDNRYLPPLKRLFRQNFPAIYGLIKIIKRREHRALARCCKRIWDEYNQEIPVFTIHDSICTTPQYVEVVRSIMGNEFEKSIGLRPHLKIENY